MSITEVKLNYTEERIEISHRVFIDDFEKTLKNYHSSKLDVIKELSSSRLDSLIETYIMAKMELDTGKIVKINYLGHQREDDSLWLFAESPLKTKVSEIYIKNTMLFEEFDDQQNIIHVLVGKDIKSTTLHNDLDTKHFKLDH